MRYAIFDIETRIDKALLNRVIYPGEGLSDEEAYARARAEQLEARGVEFLPHSFHVPVSIVVGYADGRRVLRLLRTLGEESYSEDGLVRDFWAGVEKFDGTLISFNGRTFDLPVLELRALRLACSAPRYFRPKGHRHRYGEEGHLDLYDFLTNFGAAPIRGGADLLLRIIGLEGKADLHGRMIQEFWEAGRLDEIHAYCRRDVLRTYLLFLRVELFRGRIDRETYDRLVEESMPLLGELNEEIPALP